ncbi:hypothetical protein Enr8_49590 [Blastopirellula retiformator]|uniref:Uncharacterized protein n=1 Tax=Blastopirellula retiformator TaxID=2527970 RepID=A0A5C5UV46_9BACT|nr:hypothetical protein Enr8_49590 [Blastopirellula retiformator]
MVFCCPSRRGPMLSCEETLQNGGNNPVIGMVGDYAANCRTGSND